MINVYLLLDFVTEDCYIRMNHLKGFYDSNSAI